MATSIKTADQSHCSVCNKRCNIICKGCSQVFCLNDYTNHHQQIARQLNEIENDRDQFQQTFNEQKKNLNNSVLIKQIDQWEESSIKKIQETANYCRKLLVEHENKYQNEIENKLIKLTNEIREIRQENEFSENDVNKLKRKIIDLSNVLIQLRAVSIKEVNESLVKKITVIKSSSISPFNNISENAQWKQNGVTIVGGSQEGEKTNQFHKPLGICVDDEDSVFIAEFRNHRIVRWKSSAMSGEIIAGGNGQGNGIDQLNRPTDVIVDKESNSAVICDRGNRRVIRWSLESGVKNGEILIENISCQRLTIDNRRFLYVSDTERNAVTRYRLGEKNGILVAGGNGKGDQLNQLSGPTSIFIDEDYSVYVSDRDNHRVMKWVTGATEGIQVAGGKCKGSSLSHLSYPYGLFVDSFGTLYVAEGGNDRVTRWRKGAKDGEIVIGGNGRGVRENQSYGIAGLSIDRHGHLYIADYGNNRVQRFSIDSN